MALIGNIRKNSWIILLTLGVALAAFLIMEAVSASNRGGAGALQTVGTVAGRDIDIREFQKVESTIGKQYDNPYQAKEAAWNYLVAKNITEKESEELGIGVGTEELMELQFGPNYSPVIRRNFSNPQTGKVNNQLLLQYRQQIESGAELPAEFRNFWLSQKEEIIGNAETTKINGLVSKSMFTPSFMVEQQAAANNQQVDIEYVKIPFDKIEDSAVEITDADINSFIKENAAALETEEETRVVEYAVMTVIPTEADSLTIKEKLADLKNEFKATQDVDVFTKNNDGFVSPSYVAKLPTALKNQKLKTGDVYGPYVADGSYQLAKIIDRAVVPDSVRASHILIRPQGVTEAQAEAKIDSLHNVLKNRKSTFSKLAKKFGQDGTKEKGGDLGTFSPERMVPAFSEVCFDKDAKVGGVYKVKTRFGYHLVKLTNKVFKNRNKKSKVAFISSKIIPSQATQDALYDAMNKVASENRSLEALKNIAANDPRLILKVSNRLTPNGYNVGRLGAGETSRDIVKWAYGASVNEVSPTVYTYTDNVDYYNNKYVLVGLKEIVSAGLPSAASMRNQLDYVVRNRKKGEMIASKISGSDLAKIATDNGSEVKSITGVTGATVSPAGIGYEPKVSAMATSLTEGQVSEPIVGNSGVYIVKTTAKTTAPAISNIAQARKSENAKTRSNVERGVFNSLFKVFKPEDNRAKYF